MKYLKPISILLLFVVFSVGTVSAQKGDCKDKCKKNGIESFIKDLTDKQKKEIEGERVAHLKEMKTLKNEMGVKRAELKLLQEAENADIKSINKKIEERGEIRLKMEKKRAAHVQKVRSLLTEKQRLLFDKNHSCKEKKGQKRGHKHGGKSCDGEKKHSHKEACNEGHEHSEKASKCCSKK